jgi:hypothetical protein
MMVFSSVGKLALRDNYDDFSLKCVEMEVLLNNSERDSSLDSLILPTLSAMSLQKSMSIQKLNTVPT